MSVRSVGAPEPVENVFRKRNKRVDLINYESVLDIEVFAYQKNATSVDIDLVRFRLADNDPIEVECDVPIPFSLYNVFDKGYFNTVFGTSRRDAFNNLVERIRKGV